LKFSLLLSLLIYIAYLIFIVAPVNHMNLTMNTQISYIVSYPLYSLIPLGVFILIYTPISITKYKESNFYKCLFTHLILYILFFVGFRIIEGSSLTKIFDAKYAYTFTYLVIGMSLYFTYHILLFRWISRKFKSYIRL